MVKEILVDKYKKDGERLITHLSDPTIGFKITTAMWYYLSEPEEWRLMIASPYVKENGPLKSYKIIQSTMGKINKTSRKKLAFSLDEISVLAPDDALINFIKGTTPSGGRSGISLRNSKRITLSDVYINGLLIRGAYIYFID
jgi:hypothetical protein